MPTHTPRRVTAETAKAAALIVLGVFCALGGFSTSIASAALPVRTMYNAALAREQTVRTALEAPDATPAVLDDVHAVVTAYESVVRRYPASGYSDNALWQAGRLALDAFARFGQPGDKDTGVRLLRRLAAMFPTSTLASRVPEQLARLAAAAPSDSNNAIEPKAPPLRTDSAPSRVNAGAQGGSTALRDRLATIREIRRTVLPDGVRITIELDGEVPFHDERIADPERVFVDLPGTRAAAPLVDKTLRFDGDADVVRQVRVGRHPNNTTRVVLDAGGVTSYSVYPLYEPYRLVIDCVRGMAATTGTKQPAAKGPVDAATARLNDPVPPPLRSRALTTVWTRRIPSRSALNSALLASAAASEPQPLIAVVVEKPAAPPASPLPSAAIVQPAAKNATGGLSIARQLGLSVSRIVIDPGHGGHDPGAKGRGVSEAELVLDVALRVEKLLQKVQGVEVILTRRTDDFVPLPERTAIANREGADLFLSIHANASPNPQARGIETYFLNFATNTSAAAVAARENAASTLAMGEMPDIVKSIALNNKVEESRDLASHVQRSMYDRLHGTNRTLKDLGVKQAPFVVLIGATMPSVLAEISFVTNPQEARLLKSNAYRQRIAESLFNAIRKYQSSLKSAPAVALQ